MDDADHESAPPAVTVSRADQVRRYVKTSGYVIFACALSLLASGDLPHTQTYRSLMDQLSSQGVSPSQPDPLQKPWQPVSNYVVENSLTDAMTGVERLRHEEEQRALLEPKEEVRVNIRAPLLPGRVLKESKVNAPVPYATPPIVVNTNPVEGAEPIPATAPVQETKDVKKPAPKNLLAEDTLTLEALQKALRELSVEDKTTLSKYNDSIPDR